jgi:hypothetical protein
VVLQSARIVSLVVFGFQLLDQTHNITGLHHTPITLNRRSFLSIALARTSQIDIAMPHAGTECHKTTFH